MADIMCMQKLFQRYAFQCIHRAAIAHDVVMKKFHKPNLQLSTHTLRHLKGLSEFILNELYIFHETFSKTKEQLSKLRSARIMLSNYQKNITVSS